MTVFFFRFWMGTFPTSYGVYITQSIRCARVSSHMTDFNARNKIFTAELLEQGYRYPIHYELVFGLGLACQAAAKGLSCHIKNQVLPKHLRKKTSKCAKYRLSLRNKKDPLN